MASDIQQTLFDVLGHRLEIHRSSFVFGWTYASCGCGFEAEVHPWITDDLIIGWHDEAAGL